MHTRSNHFFWKDCLAEPGRLLGFQAIASYINLSWFAGHPCLNTYQVVYLFWQKLPALEKFPSFPANISHNIAMSLLLPFRLRSGSADGRGSRALVVAATAGASPWPFGAFTTRQQGAPWWALLLSGLGLGTAVALLLRLLSWWRTWVGVPRFIMLYWDYELENCKLDTAGFAWHKSIHSTYAYMSTSFSFHLRNVPFTFTSI